VCALWARRLGQRAEFLNESCYLLEGSKILLDGLQMMFKATPARIKPEIKTKLKEKQIIAQSTAQPVEESN
jgi:hypothetical protein